MSDNKVIEVIDEIIAKSGGKLEELVVKDFKISQFTETIKEKIEKCEDLTSLNLSGCSIGSLQYFPKLLKLTRLEMSRNVFKGDELKNIISCVPNLKELFLGDNQIKEYNEIASLAQLKYLKVVSLAGCEITTKGDYREKIFSMIPSLKVLDMVGRNENEVDGADVEIVDLSEEDCVCTLHSHAPLIFYCGEASCNNPKLCEFCCDIHEHTPQKRVSIATIKNKFYEKLTTQIVEGYDILEQSNKEQIESFTQNLNQHCAMLEKRLLDLLASFKEKLLSSHSERVEDIMKEPKSSQTVWKNHKNVFENLDFNHDQADKNKLQAFLAYALTVKQDFIKKEKSQEALLKKMKESEDNITTMVEKQFERVFEIFKDASIPNNTTDAKSEQKVGTTPQSKSQQNIGSEQNFFKRVIGPSAALSQPEGENNQKKPTSMGTTLQSSLFTNKAESKTEEFKPSQKGALGDLEIKTGSKGADQASTQSKLLFGVHSNISLKSDGPQGQKSSTQQQIMNPSVNIFAQKSAQDNKSSENKMTESKGDKPVSNLFGQMPSTKPVQNEATSGISGNQSKSENKSTELQTGKPNLFGPHTNPSQPVGGLESSLFDRSQSTMATSTGVGLFESVSSKSLCLPQTGTEKPGAISDSLDLEIQNVIEALISLEPEIKKRIDDKNEWNKIRSTYHTSSTYYHVDPRYWVASLVNSMFGVFEQMMGHIAKLQSLKN